MLKRLEDCVGEVNVPSSLVECHRCASLTVNGKIQQALNGKVKLNLLACHDLTVLRLWDKEALDWVRDYCEIPVYKLTSPRIQETYSNVRYREVAELTPKGGTVT